MKRKFIIVLTVLATALFAASSVACNKASTGYPCECGTCKCVDGECGNDECDGDECIVNAEGADAAATAAK